MAEWEDACGKALVLKTPGGVLAGMDVTRPLDALNKAKDKRVIIEMKNGKTFSGILRAFDIHLNTVLDEAEERKDGETIRKLGRIFIRGDTILLISPPVE